MVAMGRRGRIGGEIVSLGKDLLHRTWNSVQCYVAGWKGGKSRGEWRYIYIYMCIYISDSLHCSLKLSQYC